MREKVPLSGFPLLTYKLRTGGVTWLTQRLLEEWRLPRTAAGQTLLRGLRAIRPAALRKPGDRAGVLGESDTLYALYDLGVAPITFDFLWFLVGAELERQRLGLQTIHVAIVPGLHQGLRKENPELENCLDPSVRSARVNTVLVAACAFLPSIGGVTTANSRGQAEQLVQLADGAVFPARYEPAFPSYPGPHEPLRAAREEGARVGMLRATTADLRAVDDWLAAHGCDSPVVTITLRSYGYVRARNSNLEAWTEFAGRLDPARFSVVFVPDTAQCLGGSLAALQDFPVFVEAAMVLGLRMALYQQAYLNLGVNNGPMGLCWLNDQTRYITFKMLNDAAPHTTPEYMEFLGFKIGESLPFATPWQQWVWQDDDLDVIESAFEAMLKRLEPGSDATAVRSEPLAALNRSTPH
jgi:hypothetical protein